MKQHGISIQRNGLRYCCSKVITINYMIQICHVWTSTDDETLKNKIMYQRSLIITRCLTLYYLPYMLFWEISLVVHEPDHFLVPKEGTNSSHVFCKDHTLKCSKSPTGPLYIVAYEFFYTVLYEGTL